MEIRRATAIPCELALLKNGVYMRRDNHAFLLTRFGSKLSRVRVFATVVDKFVSDSGNYAALTLDDGTARLRAKFFGENVAKAQEFEVGANVEVIGKIREYAGEVYIVPEIIKEIEPVRCLLGKIQALKTRLLSYRKFAFLHEQRKLCSDTLELKRVAKRFSISEEEVDAILLVEEAFGKAKVEDLEELKQVVLSLIKRLDRGEGCTYETLLKESKLDEQTLSRIVDELLNEGSCFEPRPGVVKAL